MRLASGRIHSTLATKFASPHSSRLAADPMAHSPHARSLGKRPHRILGSSSQPQPREVAIACMDSSSRPPPRGPPSPGATSAAGVCLPGPRSEVGGHTCCSFLECFHGRSHPSPTACVPPPSPPSPLPTDGSNLTLGGAPCGLTATPLYIATSLLLSQPSRAGCLHTREPHSTSAQMPH